MCKEIKDLAKGDEIVVVRTYSTNLRPRLVKIESVGRIWINLEGGLKVSKDTLKGEMLNGYVDIATYENHVRLEKLRVMVRNRLPEMTDSQMIAIGEIMGISFKEIPIVVDKFAE